MQKGGDALLLIEEAGILEHLVVVAESFKPHATQSVKVFKREVEVAHQEVGEIEACHFKEQLVLVDGIGLIGDEEDEIGIALGFEDTGCNRVAVGEHIATALPDVAHVELAAVEPASGLYAVDNHSGHRTDIAGGVFINHGLHVGETTLAVTAIQFVETSNEDEFITVGAHGESSFGEGRVGLHLDKAVSLEGFVGGSIERVFHVGAESGVLYEVWVGEQGGPQAFGVIGFQFAEPDVGHLRLSLTHI